MAATKIKYCLYIQSRAAGSFTIDLPEYEYNHLFNKFKLDLKENEDAYKNGRTNIHLGYKHKKQELKYYDETMDSYFDDGVTYILTKLEFK